MLKPIFFVGLHQPSDAVHFDHCMVSVNRLEKRVSDFRVRDWIMDSGAFTRITTGKGHLPPAEYAKQIRRWSSCGNLLAAVTQDYMCEPFILEITGLSIMTHQRLTIERYDELRRERLPVYLMPVLQGYEPKQYAAHVRQYGSRLGRGQWVGVGSVCKRNSDVSNIESVLSAIHEQRPDLRLHGFGLKRTALESGAVNDLLYSCDSQAWSYAARKQGRNANDYREAQRYCETVANAPVQESFVHRIGL